MSDENTPIDSVVDNTVTDIDFEKQNFIMCTWPF